MSDPTKATQGIARPVPLPADKLRWVCDAAAHECLATGKTPVISGAVGQERAMSALTMGLEINAPGYNIFVTGLSGSGRMYTIENILRSVHTHCAIRHDFCYVHNFDDRTRPRLIELPRGRGKAFKEAIAEMIEATRSQIPLVFEQEAFRIKREAIAKKYAAKEKELFGSFEKELQDDELAVVSVQKGAVAMPDVFPLLNGKPVPIDALRQDKEARTAFTIRLEKATRDKGETWPESADERDKLVDAAIDEIEERLGEHRDRLNQLIKDGRRIAKEMVKEIRAIEEDAVRHALQSIVDEVREEFPFPPVDAFLDEVFAHLLKNLDRFKKKDEDEDDTPKLPFVIPGMLQPREDGPIFEVNVVVDAAEYDGPPIIIERNPTFTNLFGTIEREVERGMSTTDFTRIRAGSLLRANGGYLVMYARDVLLEAGVWRTLIRTLRGGQLEIQPPESALFLAPSALKPAPVPINVKVILVGDDNLYHLLDFYEDDFPKVFKIKAEFDTTIPRNEDNLGRFAAVVKQAQVKEGLLPFAPDGVARLLEEAVRRAGRRNKVSVRFGAIVDLAREASYCAQRCQPPKYIVDAEAVQLAIEARRRRHNLIDEKIGEMMREEVLLVSSTGERVGQINGLAVYGIGEHHFGRPSRITCSAGTGRGGLVNIEREAHLSGPTHDKGVLILSGYLRSHYGHNKPIALTASLAFEQSYGGVDGDSASLAELLCLLSAISGMPIKQSFAITGSVSQKGDAQAIGGVNEKVEGFFGLCRDRGLTGEQGVVIPIANVEDLMLRPEVVEASAAGKFGVHAVSNVDEAIAIMFGENADTVHTRVAARLAELAKKATHETETLRIESSRPHTATLPPPPEDPHPPSPGRDKTE